MGRVAWAPSKLRIPSARNSDWYISLCQGNKCTNEASPAPSPQPGRGTRTLEGACSFVQRDLDAPSPRCAGWWGQALGVGRQEAQQAAPLGREMPLWCLGTGTAWSPEELSGTPRSPQWGPTHTIPQGEARLHPSLTRPGASLSPSVKGTDSTTCCTGCWEGRRPGTSSACPPCHCR